MLNLVVKKLYKLKHISELPDPMISEWSGGISPANTGWQPAGSVGMLLSVDKEALPGDAFVGTILLEFLIGDKILMLRDQMEWFDYWLEGPL